MSSEDCTNLFSYRLRTLNLHRLGRLLNGPSFLKHFGVNFTKKREIQFSKNRTASINRPFLMF